LYLGEQSYTGIFPLLEENDVIKENIIVGRCENCHLVQLMNDLDLEFMYGDSYGYRSGLNKSMIQHLSCIVEQIENLVSFQVGDGVIDIGSNDGSLLNMYKNREGIKFFGIDPSSEKFKHYFKPDITIIPDFFDEHITEKIPSMKAKVITSISMFYDLPDIKKFVHNLVNILADDGIWVCEQSYLPSMIESNSYDTICHEHLEYYTLKQFMLLCKWFSLKIVSIEKNNCNGGSLRVIMTPEQNYNLSEATDKINECLEDEIRKGYDIGAPFHDFNIFMVSHKIAVLSFLKDLCDKGYKIHGLGASTKGNVLLQYCGIYPNILECIAEINPYKYGRKTPGTNIPIVSEEDSLRLKPNYYFVLPWHFKQNIIDNYKEICSKNNIKLIFPLPNIIIV
jgi:hypothetical protein